MSHLDNITLANKKNRVGKSMLETELNRINREQLIEMRMQKNAKQRFKNKYSKLDVFDENRGSEASDVVMYETHNPGFCYRRNGDCRLPQSNITSSSVDMEDLHMLLFTNGEIDIDKVLCLYLLTAHRTETLTPPPKSQRTSFLAREQSPLERLVDRSKKRAFENKLKGELPLYILDVQFVGYKNTLRDPRLVNKIIINGKIIQMVCSVKTALELSNPEIIAELMTAAKNVDLIREVVKKPKIVKFLKSLHSQNIISSCESFNLQSPLKEYIVSLDLGDGPLEDLTRSIRKNILQMPNSNSWKLFYKNVSDTNSYLSLQNQTESEKMLFDNKELDIPSASPSITMMIPSSPRPMEEFTLEYDEDEEIASIVTFKRSSVQPPPKIMKNFQKGFSNMDVMDDIPSPASSRYEYDKLDFNKLANLLNKKVRIEARKDYNKMLEECCEPRRSDSDVVNPNVPPKEEPEKKHHKTILKQTTCEACIHKWKNPLPAPKTSKLKKVAIPVLKETSYFSSKSAQLISELIDEEVHKFEIYDKAWKPDPIKLSNRAFKKMAKGNYLDGTSIEIIDLDDLELAKIRQEIREHETKKKLAKFMNLETP